MMNFHIAKRRIIIKIASLLCLLIYSNLSYCIEIKKVDIGIDRSNINSQSWAMVPPSLPDAYPFSAKYSGSAHVLKERRDNMISNLNKTGIKWFRDNLNGDPDILYENIRMINSYGIKFLAVINPSKSDFSPSDYIPPKKSNCEYGTYPLSKIKLDMFEKKLTKYLELLSKRGVSIDAFEVGNELDLYCNNADMPDKNDFIYNKWKWFLSTTQIEKFTAGYAPFLKSSVSLIRKYYPNSKIITFGMSNPTGNSASLIKALSQYKDGKGQVTDLTLLVDGYGTHIYPKGKTTNAMVNDSISQLSSQAALLPHLSEKGIWITEWNETASALWAGNKWYFQYKSNGEQGGDLNLKDDFGKYNAMSRAEVINTFYKNVIKHLMNRPNAPVNIEKIFYYSYDYATFSHICDTSSFNKSIAKYYYNRNGMHSFGIGVCYSGIINPVNGELRLDILNALKNF
ncbi:hypothetical protein [Klebsiella michiganensis]|uniref:hypothetical protein n=2 Tax=Klebsiella TaxID=570 RepID=UPI00255ADBAA|nr:hypothetical protein [Klebsiella michiganensis]HBS0498658.1 hypothetical protein [Klebsiella pneumoniae]MDL4445014.1 hypothetical protein [Klebsiella michiganensis]MDL4486094.1 hypothetical protein [Klebsiella michiganensis]MDL4660933.1 hypothetical protein [Klebsiella michiganensis]HBV5832589.1 hypothetical protein [Klebsiella pneumoniae]